MIEFVWTGQPGRNGKEASMVIADVHFSPAFMYFCVFDFVRTN